MFICFDTEDDSADLMAAGKSGFNKKVTQIAAITSEGKHYYNRGDVPAFLKWLERQPEKFIYAHNLQYDLGNLFGQSLDKLDCTLVGGRMIKAVWGKKFFVDSFNIWPMSAKKLGKAFGLEKLETASMANDKEYVFRDVEIIRAAMLFAWNFTELLGLKWLPPTLGGLCVKIWQAWGGENCHDSSELSRQALFGGRVELFKVENESPNVCYTDINSLYPFVMQKRFPAMLEEWNTKKLPDYGVARVTVQAKENDLMILPYRDIEGRIKYPWGKFQGVWTIEEIKAAVESGIYRIIKIHEVMGTNDYIIPYGTFTANLYKARLESKSDAEKLFFKLLMNNLYGRLGTTGKIGRTVWQNEKNKNDGVPFGDKVLVSYMMPLSDETNWSHAAYVTAYGRLELLKYLRLAGAANMIYCDTDSCIFDCKGKKIPFPTGSALGEMKLVGWEKHCRTYAPKMYVCGNDCKAKGVPKRLAKQFIEAGRVEFDLPFKFREAVAFYDRANAKRLSVWRRVEKINHANYDRKLLKKNHFYPCKVCDI